MISPGATAGFVPTMAATTLALATAAAAAAAATVAGAASNRGCDAACVCDGVDLSVLAGGAWEASGGPLDSYKLSVCEPIAQPDLPRGCREAPVGRTAPAPRAVRWTGGEAGFNASGTCATLAADIVMAQQTADGVSLIYASTFNRTSHTLIADLVCDRDAGWAAPGPMAVRHVDGHARVYHTTWRTSAACRPDPPPPCTDECVCDGVDLGRLSGGDAFFTTLGEATQIAENGTATTSADGWQYYLSLCHPISPDHIPEDCPEAAGARVLQFPTSAASNRSGCTAVGTELITARHHHDTLQLIWQSPATPGHHRGSVQQVDSAAASAAANDSAEFMR